MGMKRKLYQAGSREKGFQVSFEETNSTTEELLNRQGQVQFDLDLNRSNDIPRIDDSEKLKFWYGIHDYRAFARNFKYSRRDFLSKTEESLAFMVLVDLGLSQLPESEPTLEELQTFSGRSRPIRRRVVRKVLMYQDECNHLGYDDPIGLMESSVAVSEDSRRKALASARACESEVKADAAAVPTLCNISVDSYLEVVHPYVTAPLGLLSKVLMCEVG